MKSNCLLAVSIYISLEDVPGVECDLYNILSYYFNINIKTLKKKSNMLNQIMS